VKCIRCDKELTQQDKILVNDDNQFAHDECIGFDDFDENWVEVAVNLDDYNNIGKLALLGDVWYQVKDCRFINGKTEYRLYTREDWVSYEWIKQFKDREPWRDLFR
jgi:hypothetical protein